MNGILKKMLILLIEMISGLFSRFDMRSRKKVIDVNLAI